MWGRRDKQGTCWGVSMMAARWWGEEMATRPHVRCPSWWGGEKGCDWPIRLMKMVG